MPSGIWAIPSICVKSAPLRCGWQACLPVAQGTVPYLGTFLTDLMMIDAAFRDTTDSGLINFDKRRREFEVLTQIKLFQSAASMYRILPDRHFADWFNRLPAYDDNER